MVNQLAQPTSAVLRNGETVYVNDHVYVSPPWSDRDGTPYTVCRIIEFLPPTTTPRKGQKTTELQVRLSLYYRPSDISGRNVSDFRLLLAAIHTDTQLLSNVRGKCYVRHKDRIDDLLKWKKLPDHFYFVKYFDPYIKREFEVIRTEAVNNIPTHVRDVLLERYEYILTEREMVADLTDNFRTCCVCDTWASSQESVRCEACKNNYHMACVTPPLLAKPAKGYSWVCLPCSMQRHKDVQDKKYLYQPNGSAPAPKQSKGQAKKKDKSAVNPNRPDKTHRGWPWRYFGLYTNAEDTLDPDDLIFPRAATRTGAKFQANVLTWEEQQAAEERHRLGESEAGPSRHIALERGHDVGEKNHDPTIDVWSVPSDDLASYMDEVKAMSLPAEPYDVERLDRALFVYSSLGRQGALNTMRWSRLADFNPITLSDFDVSTFESELERQGGLDTHETGKLLERRPAIVLRYSYIWKNKQLKAENEAIRQHRKVNTAHARQNKTLGAPSLGRIRARSGSNASSDAEASLFGDDIKDTKKAQCAACSTRISSVWWRAPRTIQGEAMCESCGADYRKYGVISFTKSEDSKKPEKPDNKAKKQKVGETSASTTPAPVPPKLPPCSWCRKMEPKGSMARCKTCTFSVHSMCYGIAPQDMGSEWECDLCANMHQEAAHLHPRCVLCPQDASALSIKAKKRPPADFDVLSCMKITEGLQWAHILCASWVTEVQFTNTAAYKMIENISSIAKEKWEAMCTLCGQRDGAVAGCADCGLLYHPSCAWIVGYRFGFEFSLAKPGKKEVVTIAKFREDAGVMMPGIWCKGHEMEGRTIYDMNDVDPEQNETALQIYTASYKALPQDESFALLRKATRLDQHILQPNTTVNNIVKICSDCGIDVSPRWHEGVKQEASASRGRLCHQCWFRTEK